ncbi:alpha/beta hydrolase [Ktedonosporobacter rubrisoli]|uniref:Alpha/beta hydrolase n=1 Tax=Ktedonosporobacter rubrisoli TaxID=2509675 RepID=A0A4P6JID4_KTERU|nr:alpha/beta hydrolase [Ktedonosporobacter rubrisoli]QBD74824.1 alpha/beta hydrolase [Ktedonosporobacter rubrisoli]
MPYAHLNGVDLYYQAAGKGASTIYIHGGYPSLASTLYDFSEWHLTWENELASSLHFITYDRRGCYRSSGPSSGYDLENQARDLVELLNTLHIPAAHVIGSSAGGPIALVYATLYPNRILSLTLDGTGLDLFADDKQTDDLIRQLITTLEQDGAEAAFKQRPAGIETSFGPLWLAAEARAQGEFEEFQEEQQRFTQQAQAFSADERVRYFALELRAMQAYMRDDLSAYARQVGCPTLVLHGDDDRVAPLAWSQELAELIPGAHLQNIPGVGHNPIAYSAEGRRALLDFIQGIAS